MKLHRNFLICLLAVAALLLQLLALPQTAYAAGEGDLTFIPNETGDGYIVSGCNPKVTGEMVIPASYNGLPVTGLGDWAFYGCSGLTSITIPDSVTSIGGGAFSSCRSLTDITIPDSVTSIGEDAFSGCSSLTSITIPDSVTSIGYSAFSYCTGLTSITIPDSVTSIGEGVLAGCEALTTILVEEENPAYHMAGSCLIETGSKTLIAGCGTSQIPSDGSVTTIGNYAFSGCYSLTSITIPGSVTSIGDYAFHSCTELTSIQVDPQNPVYRSAGDCLIETASKTLILGCQNSRIPSDGSVTSIGRNAFDGCYGLTSVTIPESVTSIGSYAFCGCRSLTSINIPDGVTSIGEYAFAGCEGLSNITIPDSVTDIDEGVFYWTSLTSITIPDSVTSIGNYAFYGCYRLTSITIPDSVTSIGSKAFSYCDNLNTVTFCGTQEEWDAIEAGEYNESLFYAALQLHNMENNTCTICGYTDVSAALAFSPNGTGDGYIVSGCDQTATGEMVIPATYNGLPVTAIGDSAFSGCTGLTGVTIPSGITAISEYAFNGCTGLTSITIPDSVTTISASAFDGCAIKKLIIAKNSTAVTSVMVVCKSGLEKVVIPHSVTSISDSAFSGCTSLATVICCGTQEEWDALEKGGNNDSLLGATLQLHDLEDGICAICGYKDISSALTFDLNETGNGYMVSGCDWEVSGEMVIPATYNGLPVTAISEHAFHHCSGLTGVTIPSSVTSISDFAFGDCTSLISITIPNSVTSIGMGVFFGCEALTTIQVEEENPAYHIAESCLIETESKTLIAGCSTFQIPSDGSVTSIGSWAFAGRYDLTDINIPASITSIRDYAFNNCTGLTSIQVDPQNPVYHSAGDCLIETASKTLVLGCQNSRIPSDGSVTGIGDMAFAYCADLTSITIPNSVTSIGSQAFAYCANLTSLAIPNSVIDIGDFAFINCTSLTSITIPNGVTIISDSAFSGCTGLTSITIPSSVTSIGDSAFYYCYRLTSITIPDSVTSIGDYAFSSCDRLTSVTYCGTQKQWNAISIGSSNGPLTNATLKFHDYEDGACTICGHKKLVAGEMDGNEGVDHNDAIYLLLNIMFGEEAYPLSGADGDIDGNGVVEQDDAVYLLLHSLFGEAFYPLKSN